MEFLERLELDENDDWHSSWALALALVDRLLGPRCFAEALLDVSPVVIDNC
jgi:hypothetical protein